MLRPVIFVLFAALLVSKAVFGEDEEIESDDETCVEKPCGPWVCRARCVASCLDTDLAETVDECSEKFCNEFFNGDKIICASNDTKCWKTCGVKEYSDDKPSPPKIQDLRISPWSDGYSSSNANPNSIRIEWPAVSEASLYLVEIFPMLDKEPADYDKQILRNMTTETVFSFERTDICQVYMIRVMSVNGFGNSAPRYLVVDAWKPTLNFDENFDVRGMRREGDYLKVLIDYTQPETWHRGDVELENSFVRAHQCLGPIDSELFMNNEPDEDGFYTPLVFINETGANIELSFPSKIMHSKCLYSYRISTLRTRCNVTNNMDPKTGAGVDFSINCQSVEDSDCDPESTDHQNKNQEAIIVIDPEALKELQMEENSTWPSTTTPESKEIVAKSNSKEVIIGINGDAIRELDQESTTTMAKPESAELVRQLEFRELDNEKAARESVEQSSPPSPFASESDGPPPAVVIIEPRDPNAPQCKMTDIDASVEIKKPESDVEDPSAELTLTWTEAKSQQDSSTPNYFLIRYGPVIRTLIVDAQPDIIDETILRNPSEESEEETTRTIKVTDLSPNGLYAFQICAIYNPEIPDTDVAWDTAPRYVIDISASNSDLAATTPATTAITPENPNSNATTMNFVDYFIEALNSSFNNAQESAASLENEPDENDPEDIGVLEINLPEQQPPVLMIDVKPVVVSDSSSWSPIRSLWLLVVLGLTAVIVSAFMFFIVKRSRGRRESKKTGQLQQAPIYYTHTTIPAASDVKIPIS